VTRRTRYNGKRTEAARKILTEARTSLTINKEIRRTKPETRARRRSRKGHGLRRKKRNKKNRNRTNKLHREQEQKGRRRRTRIKKIETRDEKTQGKDR